VAAFSYDRRVLLERFIAGRDLAVGIIDGPGGSVGSGSGGGVAGEPVALPVVEALPERTLAAGAVSTGTAYDYESRYEIGRTRFVCPAELDDAVTARAQAIALAAYRELGCGGFGRADLMLEESTGELFVLELNPIPGLTETSLLPLAADAAGIGFDDLIARILAGAVG
jgi:D-alanine-D-alanine ligase